MSTVEDCQKCTKPCPQAKLAHDTAVGRMYATNELTVLLKKVECGQLVEVVRCSECKHNMTVVHSTEYGRFIVCEIFSKRHSFDDFCSYGERKDGED